MLPQSLLSRILFFLLYLFCNLKSKEVIVFYYTKMRAKNLFIIDRSFIPAVSYVGEYPVVFGYLADGTKVYVERSEDAYDKLRYAGPFRYYENDSESVLESVSASGGRIAMSSSWTSGYTEGEMAPRYFITDHLGSVRMVVDDSGEVLQRNRYYPYGERIASWNPSLINNNYLYCGKEFQSLFLLPFYDSGARFQTTYGIFTSMDPLCEKYYSVSPYAYCSGDPVNYVDPEGLSWYFDIMTGEFLERDLDGDERIYMISRRNIRILLIRKIIRIFNG